MTAFRFLAWLLLALAIALLGADAVTSLESGEPVLRTTGEILGLTGLNASAMVEGAPQGVSEALRTVFDLPLWSIFGVFGVILVLIFRPIH